MLRNTGSNLWTLIIRETRITQEQPGRPQHCTMDLSAFEPGLQV